MTITLFNNIVFNKFLQNAKINGMYRPYSSNAVNVFTDSTEEV